jgi:murein DD-endopeptidase MepM/ murein hydrolase activator NlpD
VSVLDASTEAEIMKVCDDTLTARLSLAGTDKQTIPSGIRAIVYLEIDIADRKVPGALKHRVQYEDPKTKAATGVEGAHVSLNKDPLLTLDPPVAGGPWAAIYSAAWERGHRRVFYAVDGSARIPGRFAIDWIQLDEQGAFAKNDTDQVKNWLGYGADVLAVADARVAAARDNMKESETVSTHPHNHALQDATGIYIALDLGNGYFAFYEHLKPGSVRVKVGDRVQSGQIIASLGFTGDSTGPHLHFHVANRNSPHAEGVPYVFKTFTVIGSYNTLDEFGKKPWNPNNPESNRTSEFPASNVVVMFPKR